MLKRFIIAFSLLFSSLAVANNIGVAFKQSEVYSVNGIASIQMEVFNANEELTNVSIELLDGSLPETIKSTLPLNKIIIGPKQKTYVPLYVKMPQKSGKYRLTLCAKGEPIVAGENRIIVRACRSTVINHR